MERGSVLIVEDEPLAALEIGLCMLDAGYTLAGTAGSGAEALTIAAGNPPSLALVDFDLIGRMNGVETARQLHAEFGTHIIFVTGYPADYVKRQVDFPYLGVLSKPFSELNLSNLLAETGDTLREGATSRDGHAAAPTT